MQSGKKRQAEGREARLAEALRENLKRRKSQSRVRKSVPKDEQSEADAPDAEQPGQK